jgi:hypothetical protein
MNEMTNSEPEIEIEELLGKHVLVGFTYENLDGSARERKQFHGTVVSASKSTGILLDLIGGPEGEQYKLPPDMRAFRRAPSGEYRLRGTGEIVVNPDFLATWLVASPP